MAARNIYFRTRGGATQGWGNIFRLAAFAGYCRNVSGADIRFFVEGPSQIVKYLKGEKFKVTSLPEDITPEKEEKIFKKFKKADCIIMEMLDCSYKRQKMLRKFCSKLVVFDDLLDHRYDADIAVCAQILPRYANIEVSSSRTRFLLGEKYFMTRDNFRPYLTKERHYFASLKEVLVTLGGGSYDTGYIKIARGLALVNGGVKPRFILGYAAPESLKEEIKNILPNAEIYGGVNNIHEMLWGTDVAIVSAGYTKYDACMTKTPCIMVATQWHQIPLGEQFAKKHKTPYLGYTGFVSVNAVRDAVLNLQNGEKRKTLGQRLAKVLDGRGTERVYNEIFNNKTLL